MFKLRHANNFLLFKKHRSAKKKTYTEYVMTTCRGKKTFHNSRLNELPASQNDLFFTNSKRKIPFIMLINSPADGRVIKIPPYL